MTGTDSQMSPRPESSPGAFTSWTPQASACAEQDERLRQMWAEPSWAEFKLRSKTYLQNRVKETTAPPLFELLWFEILQGTHEELHHVCSSRKSFAGKALAKYGRDVPQLFVVTLIVPGSPMVAGVQYFAKKTDTTAPSSVSTATSPTEAEALWQQFLHGDDAFRKARLKLVPSIQDGPWVVKKSVGSKPVIVGNALGTKYFQTPAYLEVVVDLASDKIAKHVTTLCRSQSTSLKVDVGFVIEGKDETELPEALLGCIQYDHLDLTISTPVAE